MTCSLVCKKIRTNRINAINKKKRAEGKPKGKRGAKTIELDWDIIDGLCNIQCTAEEIAAMLNIDSETLRNRCKSEKSRKFSEYMAEKSLVGNVSIRRMQYLACKEGNTRMLVWLGKNMLGQVDKPADREEYVDPTKELTEEELIKELQKRGLALNIDE